MEKKEEFLIEIRDALARGYCTKENEKKVLDFDLIYAMGNEIEVLISQELDKARGEGRKESKREYAQAIATGQKVELTEELVDRIWSANLEEMYKMGLTKLLKNKEEK